MSTLTMSSAAVSSSARGATLFSIPLSSSSSSCSPSSWPWRRSCVGFNRKFSSRKPLPVKKASAVRSTVSSEQVIASNVQSSSFGPDLFVLDLAEKLEESDYAPGCSASSREALSSLRERSAEAALSSQWPSNKTEAYRFTDLRFLKKSNIEPTRLPSQDVNPEILTIEPIETGSSRLIIIDGVISSSLSCTNLSQGLYFGSITGLSDEVIRTTVASKLGESADWIDGDFFASLNGIGARELAVVIVPDGVKLQGPLHVLYYSSQGGQKDGELQMYPLSSPRLLVVVGKGAEVDIVEEFIGESGQVYWVNSVAEFFIEENGQVRHSCIQNQERASVHIKQTCVAQKERSSYELVEAGLGSRLNRHNLHIQQLGPDTATKISSFLLAGQSQLQDLHSKLVLSHPRGYGRQLHKCIVMHSSGHCIFDGNIKVNRYAQQTDAGQLSRSLLLAPRATVNVKPNLQIIADDVKCSHGAAISDLEEEQLFYFRARGIDPQTARSTLVFSFGAEVLQQFPHPELQKRVEDTVKAFLSAEGAINSRGQ